MSRKNIVDQRWEAGLDHHPQNEALLRAINELDEDQSLGLKMGGDGDFGEAVAYYLDELTEKHGWVIIPPEESRK